MLLPLCQNNLVLTVLLDAGHVLALLERLPLLVFVVPRYLGRNLPSLVEQVLLVARLAHRVLLYLRVKEIALLLDGSRFLPPLYLLILGMHPCFDLCQGCPGARCLGEPLLDSAL